MKKKIVIDAIMLLSPFTGIAKYTYEISKRFDRNELNIDYFYGYFSDKLIGSSNTKKSTTSLLKKIKSIVVKNSIIKKIIRSLLFKTTSLFQKNEYDLFWEPNHLSNAKIKAKYRVTTVHDLSFHLHPDWHPIERVEYFEKFFWDEIIKSDRIITGSYYSKRELLEYIEYDADKIDVIYHGVDFNNFKIYSLQILDEFKIKYALPSKYILSVGSIEPRKNLVSLIKAYKALNNEVKKEYKLILVGFKGWENNEIMSLLDEEKENINYLGYLSDKELAYVYNVASLFCYPSFYEGFGIPPLEAMACGTPVITSNISSMPEVCADAAIYVDPYNVNDIQDKIELLLNSSLKYDEMRTKGLLHVKQYTWEKAAQKHIDVFEEVLTSD